MYRSVCSPGMAVQWLSHQTGLAALVGCSGGLQREGGGLKRPKKKKNSKERGQEKDEKMSEFRNQMRDSQEIKEKFIQQKRKRDKGLRQKYVGDIGLSLLLDCVLTNALRLKATPSEVW